MFLALILAAQACTGAATPEEEGGGDTGATGATERREEPRRPGPRSGWRARLPRPCPGRARRSRRTGDRSGVRDPGRRVRCRDPNFEPGLATEVPTQENGLVSEDGLTYTFPIREGRHVPRRHRPDRRRREVLLGSCRHDGPARRGCVPLHRHRRSTRVVDDFTFEVTLTGACRMVHGGGRLHADGIHREPGRGRSERRRGRR